MIYDITLPRHSRTFSLTSYPAHRAGGALGVRAAKPQSGLGTDTSFPQSGGALGVAGIQKLY